MGTTITLRGLTMGTGTAYPLQDLQGLGPTNVRADDMDRAGADGSSAGRDLAGSRVLRATLGVTTLSGEDALYAAWAASRDALLELVIDRDAWAAPRSAFVRPRRCVPRGDTGEWSMDLVGEVVTEAFAPEPWLYGPEQATAGTIADTTSQTTVAIANGGNATVPLFALQITGPADTPRFTHSPTGRFVQVNTNLAAGQVLRILPRPRQVTIDGADAYDLVTADSTWLDAKCEIDDGTQDLVVSRTGTTGTAQVEVDHRDGWVG